MWLFTTLGFFSATLYQDSESDPLKPEIQVRARARVDLQNLIVRYCRPGDDTEIIEWENRDYPYRIILPQARWVEISMLLVSDIDYSNFKDEVKKVQGEQLSWLLGVHFIHRSWNLQKKNLQLPLTQRILTNRFVRFIKMLMQSLILNLIRLRKI